MAELAIEKGNGAATDKHADRTADWNRHVKIVELKDWGPRLPIGTVQPATGKLNKEMAHRRWNLRREKQLGKLRDENRKLNMSQLATRVMAILYSQLGDVTLSGDEGSKGFAGELLSVSQLNMGDALYAYTWLRRQCVGREVLVDARCTRCGAVTKGIPGDLDTLEIRVVEDIKDTYWTYELIEPLEIRGEKAERLLMRPVSWHAVEQAGEGGINIGVIKGELITASIAGIEGMDEMALVESEFDEMGKRDLETLTHELDRRHLGPNMEIEAECKRCRADFRTSIDWTYDSFFGVSGSPAH